MPTSRDVLNASLNARKQGFQQESEILFAEFKRLQRLEQGLPETPVVEQEDPGFFENVASGLQAGAVGMGELTSLGAAALLEEETELAARKKIKSMGDSLRPEGGDPESLTYQVSSGVGGILAALPAVGVAALSSKPLLATALVSGGLGMLSMAGEQSEMAREAGATEEERNIAIREAAPFGLTEGIPMIRALKAVGFNKFGDALDKLTGRIDEGLIDGITGRFKSAGVTGIAEGIQEFSAAIYQNLVARGYDPERELIDAGVIQEGRTGAGAGFIVQAIADAIGRRSKKYDGIDSVTPDEILAAAGYTDGVWDGEKMVYGEEAVALMEQDTSPQLDLFPQELSQAEKAEAETQGPRKPKEPTKKETEEPEPFTVEPATDPSRTPDMIEAAEEQQVQEMLDEEVRQEAELEETRKASEVETASARRDEEVQRNTRVGRRLILEEVLDEVGSTFPKGGALAQLNKFITESFKEKMVEAGYRAPDPTTGEQQTIKRFLNVKSATDADTGMLPASSDLSTLESQIKEKPDVRKQADGTPVPDTGRKGVQGSGESVVGRQPTDTERTGELVEGGLDSGVDSARKPTGRKRRRVTSLKAQKEIAEKLYTAAQGDLKEQNKFYAPEYKKDYVAGYKDGYANKHGQSFNLQDNVDKRPDSSQGNVYSEGYYLGNSQARSDFRARPVDKKETTQEKEQTTKPAAMADLVKVAKKNKSLRPRVAENVLPTITRNNKVKYKESKGLIPSHKNLKQDMEKLNTLFRLRPDTSDTAGTKVLADLNNTAIYFQKFDDPLSALYNLAYDSSGGGKKARYTEQEPGDKIAELLVGTGGKNAKVALNWAKNNLSDTTVKSIEQQIEVFNNRQKDVDTYKKKEAQANKLKKKAASDAAAKRRAEQEAEKERQAEAAARKAEDVKAEGTADTTAKKTRVSKAEKAKQTADSKFDALVYSGKDLSDPNTYNSAVDLAERSSNPKDNLKTVDEMAGRSIESKVRGTAAAKAVDTAKNVGKKPKPPTDKVKATQKAYKKFVGKEGITEKDVNGAYEELGPKKFADATIAEIKEAADTYKRVMDFKSNAFGINLRVYDALDNPITPEQIKLLQDNKLVDVLKQLSKSLDDSDLRKFAAALSKVLDKTKVKFVVESEIIKITGKDNSGRTKLGAFDPETSTILLNKDVPLNAHVVLHESGHAFIDNFMRANPTSAPVLAIKRVYKDMMDKKMLFGAYGAENVFEFAAEALASKKFRVHLDKMRIDETGAVSNLSLFARFVQAIRNMFRMLMNLETHIPKRKKSEKGNALDAIDNWILQILNPDHKDMAAYPVIDNNKMSDALASIYKPNDVDAPKRKMDWSDFWEDGKYKAGVPALKALVQVVDSQVLGDLAKFTDLGTLGTRLHRAIEEQRGMMIAASDKVGEDIAKYKDWVKNNTDASRRALNDLVYDVNASATIYQVDPTLPESTYKDADGTPKIVEGNDLLAVRKRQEDILNRLDPEERKAVIEEFIRQRNIYRDLFTKLKRALNLTLDAIETSDNKDTIRNVRKRLEERIFKKAELFVYFPLVRSGGPYGLAFTERVDNGDGTFRQEPAFITFDHRRDRTAFIELIPQMPEVVNDSHTTYDNSDSKDFYGEIPRKGFIENVLNSLEKSGVEQNVLEDVLQMYVNALPETSYSKAFSKRLNRLGYIQDVGVALEKKATSLASQIAKIEGSRQIRDVTDLIKEKQEGSTSEFQNVIARGLITEHAAFALNGARNKPFEKVWKAANQFAFMMTLGLNVSGAAVQLSQIPLYYSVIGSRFGFDNTFSALMRASKFNLGAGLSPTKYYNLETFEVKESTKRLIRKISLGDEKKMKQRLQRLEDLAPVIKLAYNRARMYSFKTMTDVGVKESQNAMTALAHWSGILFNAAERINTNTGIIAIYDLTREKMAEARKANKKYYSVELSKYIDVPKDLNELRDIAAREALYLISEVNAGATLETTSPIAKQGILRAGLMYKHYGMRMYATQIKYLFKSMFGSFMKNMSKAERDIAKKQVAAGLAVGIAYGGLIGVPLVGGIISALYDLFKPDDEDNFDEMVRKSVPEYVAKGPVSYFSGVDIQARIKLTDMLFQENRFLYDASLEEQISTYIGGPAWSSVKKAIRAKNDFTEQRYDRMFENLSPVGISNMLQAMRYAEEGGIKTRRGQFITEDIDTSDITAKALGFLPYEYSKQQDINARNSRVQREIIDERSLHLKRFNIANTSGDWERMEEVLDDIKVFNKKNPTYPIDPKDIIKSSQSFQRVTGTMQNGIVINPKLKETIDESNREFNRED